MFQRPLSISVIAVIGCIVGAFGLMCMPFVALGYIMPQDQETEQVFGMLGMPAPTYSAAAKVLLVINSALGLFIFLTLLIASIGSFWMKGWARKTMNAYGVAHLLNNLFNVVVMMIFVLPTMMSQMPELNGPASGPAAAIGSVFGAIFGFFCSSLFPICALIFYNRGAAREAFARQGIIPSNPYYASMPPPGAPFPGQYYPQQPGGAQPYYPMQSQYGAPPAVYTPPPGPAIDPGPLPPPGQAPYPPGSQPPPPPPQS